MEPPSLSKEWGYSKDDIPKVKNKSKVTWKEDLESYEEESHME